MWALVAGGALLLVGVLLLFAPARATILVDTPTSTARADLRLLWGIGPSMSMRALPKDAQGNPMAHFNDAPRIGHALMTPGLFDAAYKAIWSLFQLSPRTARIAIGLNIGDSAQTRVIETAIHASLAGAPSALRQSVNLSRSEAPGAEIGAQFELNASLMKLHGIRSQLVHSRAVREFRRRLKRPPKPGKKAPKEVRAS